MFNMFFGAVAMLGFVYLVKYTKDNSLTINWWQWLLTVLGILLAIITVTSIITLLAENEASGARFVGLVFGVLTVIWGVLLGRFVFKKA